MFVQEGITVPYTYDALFVTDGRSKRRRQLPAQSVADTDQLTDPTAEDVDRLSNAEITTDGGDCAQLGVGHLRYSCNQCGKSYATSSNLSRHKQTHRPLDSNYAKTCPTCGKVYVSMPALR